MRCIMSNELKQMQDYVWRRIGIRRLVAGRKRLNELVEAAVANWDADAVANAKDERELQVVADGMAVGVKRTHQMLGDYEIEEYGFIWAILLQALASAVIQILIKWWLESRENRLVMLVAQKEITG